jgi:hypothetical protein
MARQIGEVIGPQDIALLRDMASRLEKGTKVDGWLAALLLALVGVKEEKFLPVYFVEILLQVALAVTEAERKRQEGDTSGHD